MERPLGSRYRIGESIGRGGMGEVFRGVDLEGTPVAIKVLRPELAEEPGVVAKFVQERSILLRVNDPHLVTVRDLVVEGSTLAIVMDLVPGSDLRRALRGVGSVPPAEVARLGAGVASGLAAVHAVGVVHRDVKPENVLLDTSVSPPRVRLTDFGVARIFDGATQTTTGLMGTPAYIAPELFEGTAGSPASDLYALGMMLYELCCGVTAFAGGSAASIMHDHAMTIPGRPDGIPDPMWDLIAHLVAKDPAQRPARATAVVSILQDLTTRLRGVPAAPRLASPPPGTPMAPPAAAGLHAQTTQAVLGSRTAASTPAPPRKRRGAAIGFVTGGVVLAAVVVTGTRIFAADRSPADNVVQPSATPRATAAPNPSPTPASEEEETPTPTVVTQVVTSPPVYVTVTPRPVVPACKPFGGAPTADESTWLSSAMSGECREDVRQVQQTLRAQGFDVFVDGYYGEETEAAVREFQAQRCIDGAGKVGGITWRLLTSGGTQCTGMGGGDGVAESPTQFLKDYYALLPHDTATGWTRLSPKFQVAKHPNGRADYDKFYAGIVSVAVVGEPEVINPTAVQADIQFVSRATGTTTIDTAVFYLVRNGDSYLIDETKHLSSRVVED